MQFSLSPHHHPCFSLGSTRVLWLPCLLGHRPRGPRVVSMYKRKGRPACASSGSDVWRLEQASVCWPWVACLGGTWPEDWSACDTRIHSPGRMVGNREAHDTMRGLLVRRRAGARWTHKPVSLSLARPCTCPVSAVASKPEMWKPRTEGDVPLPFGVLHSEGGDRHERCQTVCWCCF